MKRCLFFILFLLSACGTAPTATAFDPNLSAVQSRLTAEAAQDQVILFSAMATGTAQAPIIAITQTAAAQQVEATGTAQALLYQQQSWTVTAQSVQSTETAAMTATAMAWTPTPNATMTAVFAQSYADATRVANEITLNNLEVERARDTNVAKMVILYGGAIVAMILIVIGFYEYLRRMSFIPHTVDERGKVIPMINVVDGVAFDVERAANGMIGTHPKFLKQLPRITAERQDQVTARAQLVDMATRARANRRLLDERSGQPFGLPAPVQLNTNFLLPSWEIINGWDGKHGIPYYTASGLETIDIERFPHLSAIGATGAGKSRRFFRPLIACALAAGHRVVILGKSADYWPFESHPNATLLKVNKITEPGQAARYAKILEAIIVEMNRRDDVLTAEHRSTWTHAGRNRTFIILDELGNALRLMDKDTSNQSRIWVEGGVSEGRKVGFNFVIANQRATGMASILSQTGKAIFRVEADEERAHRSLAGASSLSDGYFLAKFGASKIAGAFEPTDEELRQFMDSRPVNKLDDDDQWIDAVATDVPASLPGEPQAALPPAEPKPAESMATWVASLDEKSLKILQLYQAGGISENDIQWSVYGYTNGNTARRVKSIIDRYREINGITTTTTTTTPILPNFGAVAA